MGKDLGGGGITEAQVRRFLNGQEKPEETSVQPKFEPRTSETRVCSATSKTARLGFQRKLHTATAFMETLAVIRNSA
jgi:hypothetical protein